MNDLNSFNYRNDTSRYKYYYQHLQVFYAKPVAQVSSAVLFTIITIVFFAIAAIQPTLQTIAELLKKIEDQEQVLSAAQKKSATLSKMQLQFNTLEPDLPVIDQALPSDYMIKPLLKDIEAIAGQLNIPITSLRISDIQYPPPSTGNTPQEISFTISIDGTYTVAKNLITNLQKLPRFILIESVSFTRPTEEVKTNTVVETNILRTTIGCKAFYIASKGESNEIGK